MTDIEMMEEIGALAEVLAQNADLVKLLNNIVETKGEK